MFATRLVEFIEPLARSGPTFALNETAKLWFEFGKWLELLIEMSSRGEKERTNAGARSGD